jgi:hypothetical protein
MRSKFRLEPSVGIATLALFVALSGTSYAVGSQIDGAHLKNRSVAGSKLKKHTVTGTDVNTAGFPKVPAAQHADDATNATNSANAAHATDAANAVHATNATEAQTITGTITAGQVSGAVANATNAASAATAASVNGNTFEQINANASAGNPATLLNNFDGLQLECIGPAGTGGTVSLRIVNDSADGGSFGAGEIDESGSVHFDQGPVSAATGGVPEATTFTFPVSTGAQMNFSYKRTDGSTVDVVSGTFTIVINNGCTAFGNADASSVVS